MNAGLRSEPTVVTLVHAPSSRRADGRFASKLSEHRIVLGDEQDDAEPDGRPRPDHKLGGRPFCIQEPELEGASELLARGYVQVLQLDFPSTRDGEVRGSWPFSPGSWRWAFQK